MKHDMKAGAMIYPLPVAIISCGSNEDEYNIFTTCWMGTLSSEPPRCYISIKPSRYSHAIIKRNMEFVINLATPELMNTVDYCGITSGTDTNKFEDLNLPLEFAKAINTPIISVSPVNIECKVRTIMNMGSHDMFIADVLNVKVDSALYDEKSHRITLDNANLLTFNYGKYHSLGELIGTYGTSFKNKK